LRRLIEGEELYSLQESRQIRAEALEADYKHKQQVDRLNEELGRLREQVETLRNDGGPRAAGSLSTTEMSMDQSQQKF
jgi:polyhydroxyalkanoate synthesis regulator phasin